MNSKLHPVTFELPDQSIVELTITAHAKEMTLEEWVTILVKQAISELPVQANESQALTEAAKTLTALETENKEDDTAFNAEEFERVFAQAQSDAQKS
jgi:hypothetical protein